VGCYIWYIEEVSGGDTALPSPLLTLSDVTARPSTVSFPTSYYRYLMHHYNYLTTLKGYTPVGE